MIYVCVYVCIRKLQWLQTHFLWCIGVAIFVFFGMLRIFFLNHYLLKKKKLNLKTCNRTLLDIYRISLGEKLKSFKIKENIIILKYTHK